ncbi:MAG: hypothetical protein KC416_02440, partial [Myxococcales bacterium]|nr:hypothetical protein [Myxococcales bacterium]
HLAAVLTPMEGVRVFLGTTVQNHPTNAESFKTNTPGEAEVTMGDPNLIVTLGGEFSIGEWFSLIPTLQYPVTANPLRYGPIVTAGFRFTLPDDQM